MKDDDQRDPEETEEAQEAEKKEPAEEPEAGADAPEEPASDEQAPADAPPADPEKPLFAQGWPVSPELDRLLVAFERGNYAFVRSEAGQVAERATDPAVKAAALDLRRRIDPAPVAGILVLVAVGLLVVLAGHYLGNHNPAAPPSVTPASTNAPLQPPAGNR